MFRVLIILELSPKKDVDVNQGGRAPTWKKFMINAIPELTRFVGEFVKLLCAARGKPKPEKTWFKDGKQFVIEEVNQDLIFHLSAAKSHYKNSTQIDRQTRTHTQIPQVFPDPNYHNSQ